MESRSAVFLIVMAAIAAVGVVSFLIFLISRQATRAGSGGRAAGYQPHWYEIVLASALAAAIAALLLWQILPVSGTEWGEDTRALTFFIVMVVIGSGGLIIFLLATFWRAALHRPPSAASAEAVAPTIAEEAPARAADIRASHETPSAVRLLGLLGFGVAYLILGWSYIPDAQQYAMMLHLIYPAGLVVALVMMFDKASRAWNVKLPGETLREWLFCNAILVLYLLGYLNLLNADAGENYGAMFWDFLNVVLFLLILWVIDRKATRLRFLIAHAYLIALPILLLIWRNQMGVTYSEDQSWWGTIWPFFFLGLVFFVLELIILIVNRDNRSQGAGTAKDVVFLILYVITLISARPETVA